MISSGGLEDLDIQQTMRLSLLNSTHKGNVTEFNLSLFKLESLELTNQ